MPQTPLEQVLHYLRRTFATDAARDLTDGELLKRFVDDQEEAAVTILVQRHGPMVLSVCQRVLGNSHGAEDAFQATFMVLVRRGITLSGGTVATVLCDKVAGAQVSALLTIKTVKAATLIAAGKSVAGGCLSKGALALAEEAIKGMFWIKSKLALMVMAVGLAVGGAGWARFGGLGDTVQPVAFMEAPKTTDKGNGPAQKEPPQATARLE